MKIAEHPVEKQCKLSGLQIKRLTFWDILTDEASLAGWNLRMENFKTKKMHTSMAIRVMRGSEMEYPKTFHKSMR